MNTEVYSSQFMTIEHNNVEQFFEISLTHVQTQVTIFKSDLQKFLNREQLMLILLNSFANKCSFLT